MISGVIGLVYFLNNSIKRTIDLANDAMGKKIDGLGETISNFKQAFAARSAEIDYIKAELEVIKRRCWDCEQRYYKERGK
jgi:hypothetical protein